MPAVTGYTSHKNKAANPDILGTIFHLFNYMYYFINGIVLYTLFLLFNLGSFFFAGAVALFCLLQCSLYFHSVV